MTRSAVVSAGDHGSGGQWFESRLGRGFCTHKEKLIYTKDHELNCLACRSRAILPTSVGLCFTLDILIFARRNLRDNPLVSATV